MNDRKKVSIIIVTHSAKEHLINCLATLKSTTATTPGVEVVVVDNASDYGELIKKLCYDNKYRYVRNEKNLSFSYANAKAIAETDSEYVLLLNDDTTAPHDFWLEKLLDFADAHPKAAVVGTRLLFPNGTIQHCGIVFNQYLQPFHRFLNADIHDPRTAEARQCQAVTFACALIRREAYDKVGGFTHLGEEPAYHYEDVDLCLKARSAGYEVWYCPEAILYHLTAQSYGKAIKNQNEVYKFLPQFIEKWKDFIEHDDWKEMEAPVNYPHVVIGIPLSEASDWIFERMAAMIMGFHYWKKYITIVFCLSDSGPNFVDKVTTWSQIQRANYRDILISTSVPHFSNKMQSIYYNREQIRQAAIQAQAEYLFFIDSDVSMGRDTLKNLVKLAQDHKADIAAVPYPYKLDAWAKPRPMLFRRILPAERFRRLNMGEKLDLSHDEYARNQGLGNFEIARDLMDGGVHDLDGATGMGCTLISRKALDVPFRAEDCYGTEDLSWFALAMDAGLRLVVDTGEPIFHLDKNGYVYCWWNLPTCDGKKVYKLTATAEEVEKDRGIY